MFNQQAFYGPDDHQRSHLNDIRTWSHNEAIVTFFWAGDQQRFAVCTDDSGRAGEAPISDYCRTHPRPTIQLLGSDQLHPFAQPEPQNVHPWTGLRSYPPHRA